MQKLVLILGAVALLAMTHMMMNAETLRASEESIMIDDSLISEWNAWKSEHVKVYANSEEEAYRLSIWLKNKQYIDENQGEEYTLGLNLFSDLSNEEWKALYLMNKGVIKSYHTEETSADKVLPKGFQAPTSVNWVTQGKTISVLNQGQCGSCWAFSTVESIDSAYAVTKGGAVPNLSEQQVTSCSGSYGE